MLKWVGGIAATVIAGVLVAVLVQKYKSTPKVIVTSITPDTIAESNRQSETEVTIFNEGEATAQECQVYLNSASSQTAPARSQVIGIKPKEELSVSVRSNLFIAPGKYRALVYIKCNNFESEVYKREFEVLPDIRELIPR
jgi:hypothetical protein